MPDFTSFDVSVGTKSSPEHTTFVFSNGNALATLWFTHLCCGPLTCRARHVAGPPRSTKQRPITHYLKRGPLLCRRCLEVKYSLILVASAALPSRAASSLWIYRHFGSPSPAGARRWEVGIAPPPLLAGTPTAGRQLQAEQPPKSEPSHMFRTAAPPVSA